MAGTAQFNGEVGNIESNINKVDSFDESLSEEAAKQKYPSMKCLKEFLSVIYPIGSIYISAASTSPSTLFGGTWERIKDTFLLAAGDKYPAGSTGGEAEHTLTVDEMPSHEHAIRSDDGAKTYLCCTSGSGGTDGPGYSFNDSQADQDQNISGAFYATATGGGQPHNNMPPYLAVYVWKRIA